MNKNILELFEDCFEKVKKDHYGGNVCTRYVLQDIAEEIGRHWQQLYKWKKRKVYPDENNRERLEYLWQQLNGGVK